MIIKEEKTMEASRFKSKAFYCFGFLFIFLLFSCNNRYYKNIIKPKFEKISILNDMVKCKAIYKVLNDSSIIIKLKIKNISFIPIFLDTTVKIYTEPQISREDHEFIALGTSLHKFQTNLTISLMKIGCLKKIEKTIRINNTNKKIGIYLYYLKGFNSIEKEVVRQERKKIIVPKSIVLKAKEIYFGWFGQTDTTFDNQIIYIKNFHQ